jgi:hypothetical protein
MGLAPIGATKQRTKLKRFWKNSGRPEHGQFNTNIIQNSGSKSQAEILKTGFRLIACGSTVKELFEYLNADLRP